MDIREYIRKQPLVFDGGMGTYFSTKNHSIGAGCELANLSQPQLISEIHSEYLEAGCKAIKTNTFGANRMTFQGNDELVERCISAGFRIASEQAEAYDAAVFADIGPVTAMDERRGVSGELKFLADIFIDAGAKNFLFETFASPDGIRETAEYIRKSVPDAFIIASFAVQPDGFTREGVMAAEIFEELTESKAVDALGFNCVSGARHMNELLDSVDTEGIVLSVMPNAGYPVVIGNRTFYEGDPQYFAGQILEMARKGAVILGGCCGTAPEHIRAVVNVLAENDLSVRNEKTEKRDSSPLKDRLESHFWNQLKSSRKVIAVELDSPANADLTKFMSGAWELKTAGADIITIADCPIARARMDSSILACKIRRELNIDTMPHMTCRDRNLNASKALLLGNYAEGIRNVLIVTGDPIPTAERDEVKSVYQFNSRKMAAFVSALSKHELPGEFHIFGALNVNALNFDVQLSLAKEKEAKGMAGFLTQPVLTEKAFENLKRARKELKGYILGGIMPVVSERNALFMNSEVNGIEVDESIVEMYRGKNREEGEELARRISVDIMYRIAPWTDGFYIITPFGRTGLVRSIIESYKEI